MNLKRTGILLFKELGQGPKNFMFIFAVAVPLVMTAVLTLLFGALFSGQPRLGVADAGASRVTRAALALDVLVVKTYPTEAALKAATGIGAVDVGLVLPANFDAQITGGGTATLTVYVWGESLIKHRAAIVAAVAVWLRDIAGQTSPVDITSVVLGEASTLPWEQRLLPFVVLMSIMLGGAMLPASSLVLEKQKRTLTALAITPASMSEIYVAKGVMGVLISVLMGLLTLALNRAFGSAPLLLVGVLALGAAFAAEFGVLLGILVKDINTLFATVKSMGLLLYAPALISMFPEIPQWIGRLFPTYYIIQPVMDIAQKGAGLGEVAGMLGMLVALMLLLGVGLGALTRRMQRVEG